MQKEAYGKYQTEAIKETINADTSTVRIDPTQLELVLEERIKQIEGMTLDQDLKQIGAVGNTRNYFVQSSRGQKTIRSWGME